MRLMLGSVALLALAACASDPSEGVDPGATLPSRIVLAVSGGISGLADTTVIDRGDTLHSLVGRTGGASDFDRIQGEHSDADAGPLATCTNASDVSAESSVI